ncbi:MAG: TIGR04255 family protein [Gammaproteobacteria bacterium]|nr:TIGR04255 family protein [Gammaproteobacteria bacterium]
MRNDRRYKKPPVIEALCEVYFVNSAWDDAIPGQFYDRMKDRFPAKRQQEIHEAEFNFGLTGEAAAGVRRLAPRLQMMTEQGDRMIQLARDLLVVNQLRPYPHFEEWEPIVYQALNTYSELAQPNGITRLGIRYINQVAIPESRILMEDYFTLYPRLPETLGDAHGPFMIRLEIPSQMANHTVLVTFATTPPEKVGESAFLLDVYDIFAPSEPFSLQDITSHLQDGHKNIENAFESSITEKLRTLFEPEDKP